MLSNFRISPTNMAIVILSLLCCFLLLDRCRQRKAIAQLSNERAYIHDTVETFLDAAGLEHSEIPNISLSPSEVKSLLPQESKSLTSKLGADLANFSHLVSASTQTAQTIEVPATPVDTSLTGKLIPSFHYHDAWIDISGTVLKDTVDLTYHIRDSLWFSTYWKRTGLFKKELLLDGFSADPSTTIAGLTGISLDQQRRPVRLSFGPILGYGFIGGQLKPTLGFGIQYNLISF